jgi:hypothetical protein
MNWHIIRGQVNGAHVRLCRNFDVQAVSSLVSLLGVPC